MVFIEDQGFQRRRKGLLDEDGLFALMEWLEANPEAGKVIPSASGLRKIRWAAKGHGKRGGVRVIYFWWITDDRILFLDIYAKGQTENRSVTEIEKLKDKIVK